MLLTVDVGNTQTVLGLFDGPDLFESYRIKTDPRVTADELARLLALSESKKGSDAFAQVAGPSEDKARYRVATTDYLARVSPVYRDFFNDRAFVDTGLEVRDEVRKWIERLGVD